MMTDTLDKKDLFETIPVRKALMTMAVPTIASQLINLVYNVVDTIYIGRVGNPYMTAATTLGYVMFFFTIAFSNLLGVGGGSLLARLSGKGENERAKAVCSYSFYGAVLVALTYSVLIGIFMTPALNALGASKRTLDFARQYVFIVVVLGNLPVILSAVTAHLLRNAGYSRQASIGLGGGGLLNILLDPLFMFVLLPQGMEVAGAAIATLLSNLAACIYLVVTLFRLSAVAPLSMNLKQAGKLDKKEKKEIFSVGIPSALLPGLFDVANMILNSLMAVHGDFQLAALGIVLKAERLPTAVNMGICQGALPLIAYNYSSGNVKRMRDTVRISRIYGFIVTGCTILLYSLFAGGICRIFLKTTGTGVEGGLATITFAAFFLRIRCLASPFQMMNFNTSYCMQAVGYGSGALIHTVFREIICYIPMMFLLNSLFAEAGLVSAFPLSELAGAVFAMYLWHHNMKKTETGG